MDFISWRFILFFSIVFFLYYFPLKEKGKIQNILLLIASYFFYGMADYKMLLLLIIATVIFYFIGKAIVTTKNEKNSSLWTNAGIILGLGLLFYFKYFSFFVSSIMPSSFVGLLNDVGFKVSTAELHIIVPLGISFFTFKLISYVIEVHRRKMEPTDNFIAFATYIAFFPTIMSGPIDRPNVFIPQLIKKRSFDYDLAVDGCRQFIWGLFQKTVIADNLAIYTSQAWSNIQGSSGGTLFLAALLYSFQIYTDFSGYSDMAIGIGKVLGFRIAVNFKYPFFATNIAEFWRRWHISLTSWLTDYVFMPLNIKFRNWGKAGIILAILINMFFVGLWHGANWTYVVFGLYHGLLFIPLIWSGSFFKKKKTKISPYGLPSIKETLSMAGTFLLVTFGLVIFRAENLPQAFTFIKNVCMFSGWAEFNFDGMGRVIATIILLLVFIVVEWWGKKQPYALAKIVRFKRPIRWFVYLFLIFLIGMYMQTTQTPFIYFKF